MMSRVHRPQLGRALVELRYLDRLLQWVDGTTVHQREEAVIAGKNGRDLAQADRSVVVDVAARRGQR